MDIVRYNPVALKMYRSIGPKNIDAFRREVDLQRMVMDHPNICKILETCNDSGVIVLEYADVNLRAGFQQHQPFSEPVLRSIAYQILAGLRHMHERCVIHRDLKPDNILMTSRGCVKICDFGLAASTSDVYLSDSPDHVVTMNYRSPDMLAHGVATTTAIDMWSFGCIIAELALGERVFPGKNPTEVLCSIMVRLGAPCEGWANGITSAGDTASLPASRVSDAKSNIKGDRRDLIQMLKSCNRSDELKSFLMMLLQYDPVLRLTADRALKHSWLSKDYASDHEVTMAWGIKEAAALQEDARLHIRIKNRMQSSVANLIDEFEITQYQVHLNAFQVQYEAMQDSDAVAEKRDAVDRKQMQCELRAFLDSMAEFADVHNVRLVQSVAAEIRKSTHVSPGAKRGPASDDTLRYTRGDPTHTANKMACRGPRA